MYNEVIKNEYIKTIVSKYTKEICIATFNRIQKFEEEFKLDIYEMSESELSQVLNDIAIICGGTTNKGSQVYSLENYIKWCLQNNIPNCNDNIFNIEIDPSEKIRAVMLKNPEQLEATLNAVFKPIDKNTIDNVYRCAIWLLYSGIKKEDLEFITKDNVDLDSMLIKYNSKSYKIYPESVDVIKSCISLTCFNIIHPSYKDGHGIDERYVGDSILRTTTGNLKPLSLQQLINRKIKSAESNGITVKKIKTEKIRLSGIFYRAYILEKQGVDIDFTSVVNNEIGDKGYKGSAKKSSNKIITDRAREYSFEYSRWKSAMY